MRCGSTAPVNNNGLMDAAVKRFTAAFVLGERQIVLGLKKALAMLSRNHLFAMYLSVASPYLIEGRSRFIGRFSATLFLLMALLAGGLRAQESGKVIVVKQGPVEERFVVAEDQLYLKEKAGKEGYVSVPSQATMAGLTTQSVAIKKTPEDQAFLVLLDADNMQDESKRRVLFKTVLVELAEGVDDKLLAAQVGAVSKGRMSFAPSYCVFQAAALDGALTLREALKGKPGVIGAEAEISRDMIRYLAPNDTLFPQQWHLRNTGQNGAVAGIDANVSSVWDTYKGSGVWILIVDDSLQETHPDLQPNVNSTIAWDYRDGDSNPAPVGSDAHGTAVAGIAAARGNNNLGVAGAAFEATISGVRLIGGPLADSTIAAAINHSNSVVHISNNSWGPSATQSAFQTTPVIDAALASATAGRNGLGKIILFAAGNGGPNSNVNLNNIANSIYTIAVAALNDQGQRASYSTPGAALVVAAPSGRDSSRPQGSTTADVTGNGGYNPGPGEVADTDYTQLFNGTSSATPLVSGVVALVLQANPNLGWRDVQEILIRSAKQINPSDIGWALNGAGYHFHHDFGAGMIDAQAAVTMAQTWSNLGTQTTALSALSGLAMPIPDGDPNGITVQFTISSTSLRAEHVTLNLDVQHQFKGDLEIILTSPTGMQSRLVNGGRGDLGSYSNYRFMSTRHWGERAAGTWTLRIADVDPIAAGTLTGARLTVYGSDALPSTPGLSINDVSVIEGNSGTTNLVFNVSMFPAASVPVTVSYSTVNQTAAAGSDFVSTNGLLTFAAGTTNQTVTVAVNGDLVIEPHETFLVMLSNPSAGAILTDVSGVGRIQDDDLGSFADLVVTPNTNVLQLVSSLISTNSGMIIRNAQLKAHNGGGFTSAGTYQLVGPSPHTYGLTLPGLVISSGHVDDYETGPDVQPGNTTAFGVPADAAQEALLDTITGGIWDHNDVTQLDIYFDVIPGSNNVTFQVVFGSEEYPDFVGSQFVDGFGIFLNGTNIAFESGLPININHPSFAALIGTELNGVMAPGGRPVLTFSTLVAPGSSNNVLTFIVADTSDDVLDTTVFVSSLAALPPPPIPVATILDAAPVVEGNTTTNINFEVQLSLVSTQQVSVAYLVANGRAKRGEDFVGTSGRLVFPPNVTNAIISVPIIGDLIDEPEEGFSVVIFSPSNSFVGRAQAFTTIIDDDPQGAKVSISDAIVTEGDSGTVDLVFQLRLSEPSGHVVTVNYGTAPGTASVGIDYLPQAGTLAFEPGETNKTLVVKVAGDTLREGDETFFMNLSAPTFAVIEDNQGQATITDNDPVPTLAVADVSVTEGDSGTTDMVFIVTLSNPTASTVTVDYATANGSATVVAGDYSSASGTLTFQPGQLQATVTVGVAGDLLEETNETLTLNLSNPSNAGPGDMAASGTILNDDGPHLSIAGARVQEGGTGTTTNAIFVVTLVKPDADTVTVEYEVLANGSAAANVDYVPITGTLTFPDGTISQDITVVVNGDILSETNETFTVRLKNVVNGTIAVGEAQGVIVDDDTIANLAVGISLPATNIYVNYPFSISLAVTNQGTFGATNVVIEQVLPAGFQLVSSSFTTATGTVSQAGDTVRGVIPALTNGQTTELVLQVTGATASAATFAVSVSADQFDNNLLDNVASADKELLEPIVIIEKAGSLLVAESLQPANRGLDPNESVTIAFRLKNTGTIATTNLVAILRSENGVTTSEPPKVYGSVVPGDAGVAQEFVFSVQGAGGSTITAVLDLYDMTGTGSNSLGSVSYAYQLSETVTLVSGGAVSIPAVGPAATYPSTVTAAGLLGRVAKVTVQINGLTHGFPDDLDILLVAPNGQGVILMSDAGGSLDLAGVDLVFDDAASASLPDTAKINAGLYKPTNFGAVDAFSGAPAGPYSAALAAFVGSVPNGNWQLYIVDDGAGDAGSITGWSLFIQTTIPADPVAELAVIGTSTPNPVYVGQNFTYALTISNIGPAPANNLRLISRLPAGVTLVTSTPAVSATDGSELTFNLGSLAVGASSSVTIEVVSSAPGTPTNFVSVVADEIDLQSQNSSVAVGTRVNRVTMLATTGTPTPGGPFTINLAGQAGLTYVIEVSTNLVNWTPIHTNTTLDGVINFTDTTVAGTALRFYRAVER